MSFYPVTRELSSVSIILPVIDETWSLTQTVDVILRDARQDICEFLIVICDRTKEQSLETIRELQRLYPELIVVHRQSLPFLGGAIREAFDLVRGSHVVMMASDLETDPADVKSLIVEARRHPDAIITASRWVSGGRFQGYSRVKLVANWIFQQAFSLLFATRLSDMTYGYRLFPSALVRSIHWEELRHPFLFETLIKPLRLGVQVIEIPSVWRARSEGESNNTFMRNFLYLRTGVRTRFTRPAAIVRS